MRADGISLMKQSSTASSDMQGSLSDTCSTVVADGAVPPEVAALLAQLGGKIVAS